MDIIKLTAFVDLAETLSYTKTAARLFSTQATISKQILALEKELDITLVDRTHRQIDLTEAVRLVLPYAKTIVAAQAEMISTLKHQRQVQSMTLTIHSIPSVSQYRAFNLIAAFAQQHPEVDLHFSEAETDTLLPSLKKMELVTSFLPDYSMIRQVHMKPSLRNLTVLWQSCQRLIRWRRLNNYRSLS